MAKRGRKTKYKKVYAKKLIEYFDSFPTHIQIIKKESKTTSSKGSVKEFKEFGYLTGDMPTLFKFARSIDVHVDTLLEWSKVTTGKNKKLKYPEFSGAYNMAKEIQKEWLINVGLKGIAPPASFIFVAKNVAGMTDKQEIDHTTKGEKVVGITYITPSNPDSDADTN